ncbi:MAG TPA: hypothetical protein VGR56_04315 [Nitrososphaerales archaeon]|nr:hypothetical protein [Nitrososphaerales archaeon]
MERTVDLHSFKEKLRAKLPAVSPVLSDLLLEPDSMHADSKGTPFHHSYMYSAILQGGHPEMLGHD